MSLDFNNSLLSQDIQDITSNHKDIFEPGFLFEVILHTEKKDLTNVDGILINNIYIIRDYITNISDYIEINLTIPFGTFIFDVYDYLDNIEVSLIATKQLYKNKKPVKVKEKYKAVYLLDKNTIIPNMSNYSKEDLNQRLPLVITLQLLDRSVETLRIKTTQGNFDKILNKNNDMSIKTYLKSVISEQCNKILIENKPCVDFIYIEEPDNKDDLKSITLPSGTRVIEIADYIQENNIGIYNAGIGTYIQKFGIDYYTFKKCFFIYSTLNGNKFKNSEYKIIFYNPIVSIKSIDNHTYKYENKVLKILPHSIKGIQDNKETLVMSRGSGIRVSNANSMMRKPVIMKEEGPIFKKDQLVTEIAFKSRRDGLNFAPNKKISNNLFKLTSEVLQNQGNTITIDVSNLDPDYIHPGASCKIMYEEKGNKIKEIYGVIQKCMINFTSQNLTAQLIQRPKSVMLNCNITIEVFSLGG